MKKNFVRKALSVLLCVALLIPYMPQLAKHAEAAPANIVVDPGTAYTWETMLGTDADGNRYAGRVWADKSVFKEGDTVILNTRGEDGSSFEVSLADDEAFQVIFSTLGSSMTTTETSQSVGPMDVVLVLDTSTSMDDEISEDLTRLEVVIDAANRLLDDLNSIPNVRIAIVTYNADSETVIGLNQYTNGVNLVVNEYYNNSDPDSGVVYAKDDSGRTLGNDSGYTMGTNLQAGIDRGFEILSTATDVSGRIPVAIVLTDGQANRAVQNNWYTLAGNISTVTDERLILSTLLNAAWNKAKVEAHYGVEQKVYGISVDLDEDDEAHAIMNPGDTKVGYGFNANNSHEDVRVAYQLFENWAAGRTVSVGNNWNSWSFDHNYDKPNNITDAEVVDNINYVDTYYDVQSANLDIAFEQIYTELSSTVFNPITDSTTVVGGTGVDDTPLIYVDNIGKYMEIKEVQAITLFGASYNVIKNQDGTYTVEEATGTNPTTNELWNTADDIEISVVKRADGTDRLEVEINQEILPIILEKASSETINDVTEAELIELGYPPLRVFYTVGLDSDILLPNGTIDVTKIDSNYPGFNKTTGEITLYSNAFGELNTADTDGNGFVDAGDAHIGFKPSIANRYYYHQSNQEIFSSVTNANGSAVSWEEGEYGVLYEEGKFDLTLLKYDEYSSLADDDEVYTYVSFYRPIAGAVDASAEEVTYLVFTNWGYLKESIAFYDMERDIYVNYEESTGGYVTGEEGFVIPLDKVASTIAAYRSANANSDIVAVLGKNSLRTSRFHNMQAVKGTNESSTADLRYDPDYTYETSTIHNGNDVVVWLGNNGRITVTPETGISVTKYVTEEIGSANDTYAITVTIPSGTVATPVVTDANGNDVTTAISEYTNNVLTLHLKANETVYVNGIPEGTVCTIGEDIPAGAEYYIQSKTDTVTVPTVADVVAGASQYAAASVTNTVSKYGNLLITKGITGAVVNNEQHAIPESVYAQDFNITVHIGTALAGEKFAVEIGNLDDPTAISTGEVTVDASGNVVFTIKARQTIEILGLPVGTVATVTENLETAQAGIFTPAVVYIDAEGRDSVSATISAAENATAVVVNTYAPKSTSVDLDIVGTKNFEIEGTHNGGSFTYKVQKWNGTAWEDIVGKTAVTTYDANTSGVKNFLIEDVLAGVTYNVAGSHAYQVLEVKGDVENVTYDRTLYTFSVAVEDNNGQLVATVTDLNGTAITDGTYEVLFENTYHTAPVSIDIDKTVNNLSGDNAVSKAGFHFNAVRTDVNWTPLTGAEASTLTVTSDAAGEARVTATYKEAGIYYYVLKEDFAQANGWAPSNAEYRVTVEVTKDAVTGNLSATLHIAGINLGQGEVASVDAQDATKGAVTFVNTYDPDDVSVNPQGKVTKSLTGKTLEDNMFTFYVCENGSTTPILTGTNAADGTVTFNDDLDFTTVGRYEYDVFEAIPSGATLDTVTGKYVLNGMSYDATIYDLVVEVTNDLATGKLVEHHYFENALGEAIAFENSYKNTPTQYTISGTKRLHGRAAKADEFSFELYDANGLVETVKNLADSTFSFATLTFDEAGTYNYTIKEVLPADADKVPGIIYSGADKDILVAITVRDNNGALEVSNVSVTDEQSNDLQGNIVFENSYVPEPAKVTFTGKKTLEGGTLNAGDFTFALYETDATFDITGKTPVTKTNIADGTFAFDVKSFDKPGIYFYSIVEDASNPIAEVVYDGSKYDYSVTVSDDGSGALKATVLCIHANTTTSGANVTIDNANFVNATFDEVTQKEVYLHNNTTTQIDGSKVSPGDVLTYFINYTNYTGHHVEVTITDVIPEHTSYVEGSASHNGTYAGTHLLWNLQVHKGESVTVQFQVVVDDEDILVSNTAVINDGKNTYHTNEVTNHTVDEVVEKDVFLTFDPTANIDGKAVFKGAELIYEISYTNITNDLIDITIVDEIPRYTTYITDSADNGGVYQDGKITWDIQDIPSWTTVTVSFKVRVNTNIGAVGITNQASVVDAYNSYDTNMVVNYIPHVPGGEEPQPTPTPGPGGSTPETPNGAPKTGDSANLPLWYAVMGLSAVGILVTCVPAKKRREEE